jgi:hypothetical protein
MDADIYNSQNTGVELVKKGCDTNFIPNGIFRYHLERVWINCKMWEYWDSPCNQDLKGGKFFKKVKYKLSLLCIEVSHMSNDFKKHGYAKDMNSVRRAAIRHKPGN